MLSYYPNTKDHRKNLIFYEVSSILVRFRSGKSTMTTNRLTTSLIPCCTCGAIITPNPSNQCAACLATIDISSIVQRGPGGQDLVIHQCRQCRRYDRNGDGRHFMLLDPESPDMMATLLKQIPALSGKGQQHMRQSGVEALHLLDSLFIWTEPNSMRMRLMLTLKADINEAPRTVSIQQRVKVEFKVQWRQCNDCIKESRSRTWQAILQLRQKTDGGGRRGLLIMELAIARNAEMRKHILQVQTKKSGFDFYFASLDKARHFAQFLAKAAPMRIKTSQTMVSEDRRNNTANVKHTISCDMVPLCRDDLIVVEKQAKGVGRLTGRLCLVLKTSSVLHLVDASPVRDSDLTHCMTDLHADNYWKGGEKSFRIFLPSKRLVRFVVLDVEMCCEDERERYRSSASSDDSRQLFKGTRSGVSKYALADIEVARESDFGSNDETFRCVTHLGNLLSVGDTVMGYDLASAVFSSEAEWTIENSFTSSFVIPDVVLVRKVKGTNADGEPYATTDDGHKQKGKVKAKSSASKKRDRRLKKEEEKQRKLEKAAARMGLGSNENIYRDEDDEDEGFLAAAQMEKEQFERELELDEDLAEDLEIVERELAQVAEEEEDGHSGKGNLAVGEENLPLDER
mmetsp:Transcript_2240/g.4584  ORF Transcript_2240/g.4584 Transcript_2240/m.4584 type:complete len:626 (-) Transcript_2240:102-1979(-)